MDDDSLKNYQTLLSIIVQKVLAIEIALVDKKVLTEVESEEYNKAALEYVSYIMAVINGDISMSTKLSEKIKEKPTQEKVQLLKPLSEKDKKEYN